MEFVLLPVRGGETEDALLVHLPASGVLFVGDIIMPYLGAPFMPEGSAEELFAAMATIRALAPRLLIHGHPSLTESFPIEVFPALESALREIYQDVLHGIAAGQTLAEILHHNLPARGAARPAGGRDAVPGDAGERHQAGVPAANRLLETGRRGHGDLHPRRVGGGPRSLGGRLR